MDVMKALKQMPNESIDMQITSPPYWGLRDYGIEGQIGLEPDFNDFITKMLDIFNEVKRVLKKDGTCWVNFGDTYSSGSDKSSYKDSVIRNDDKPIERLQTKQGMIPKCLMMIPERFALGMIGKGWILRNKIIWHKPNHMPTSVKDRFANSWEYLYFFSKSKKYYFDLDAVREPHQYYEIDKKRKTFDTIEQLKDKSKGQFSKSRQGRLRSEDYNPKGKNPDDVIQDKKTTFTHGFGSKDKGWTDYVKKYKEEGKWNPKYHDHDDLDMSRLSSLLLYELHWLYHVSYFEVYKLHFQILHFDYLYHIFQCPFHQLLHKLFLLFSLLPSHKIYKSI